MKILLSVALLLLCSCSTVQVLNKQYQPEKTITVKYLNDGVGYQVRGRKEKAEKEAVDFCGHRPTLISEAKDDSFRNYVILTYKCE